METPIRTTGELGPLLKRLRKAKHWSQTELSRQIGLSQERNKSVGLSVVDQRNKCFDMEPLLANFYPFSATGSGSFILGQPWPKAAPGCRTPRP
jgi:hypothetical protein